MGKEHEEHKSFASPRDALSFLLNDETEAVNGYDLVLRSVPLEEADRIKLERIRNAEIDHIKDLSDIYQKYSTAKFVGTDSKSVTAPRVGDARAPGSVVKTDGGWIITSDHNGWLMYSPHHHGVFRYGTTFREQATVFKTEAEANKVAQEMLREAYGVKDSAVMDYSARGSFNSIGELKSHYSNATLLPEGDKITVVLKSGAELVYSYVGNGRLAFIRGRN